MKMNGNVGAVFCPMSAVRKQTVAAHIWSEAISTAHQIPCQRALMMRASSTSHSSSPFPKLVGYQKC